MRHLIFFTFLFANMFAQAGTQVIESKDISNIDITNNAGDIKVSASNNDKIVLTSPTEGLPSHCKLVVETKNKTLVVTLNDSGYFFQKSCKINISAQIPKNIAAKIKNGSGNVGISGTAGDIDVSVGAGDTELSVDSQKVAVSAGAGDVTINKIKGSAEITTGTGDIKVSYETAPNTGDIKIATGTGDATLYLPPSALIKAEMDSGLGSINNDFSSDTKSQLKVSMTSGTGDVTIKKK